MESQKQCRQCKVVKPASGFSVDRNTKDGFHNSCRACETRRKREALKARLKVAAPDDPWLLNYQEKRRCKDRRRMLRSRSLSLAFLGGKCVRCGFDDPRALQVDHINGGGCQERKQRGVLSAHLLMNDIAKCGLEKYQLLCANCHVIKTYHE